MDMVEWGHQIPATDIRPGPDQDLGNNSYHGACWAQVGQGTRDSWQLFIVNSMNRSGEQKTGY